MVVVAGVTLSSVYVVSNEFLKGVGNGGVFDDFVYEGDYVNGVEDYCYECCALGWSFLVEAVYDWVYDGVEGSGGRVFGLETVLMSTLW